MVSFVVVAVVFGWKLSFCFYWICKIYSEEREKTRWPSTNRLALKWFYHHWQQNYSNFFLLSNGMVWTTHQWVTTLHTLYNVHFIELSHLIYLFCFFFIENANFVRKQLKSPFLHFMTWNGLSLLFFQFFFLRVGINLMYRKNCVTFRTVFFSPCYLNFYLNIISFSWYFSSSLQIIQLLKNEAKWELTLHIQITPCHILEL